MSLTYYGHLADILNQRYGRTYFGSLASIPSTARLSWGFSATKSAIFKY